MDGVPCLKRNPVATDQYFNYNFEVQDAGTYLHHPHVNTSEQMGRGLSGAFIVEEEKPVEVDRRVVWALDDWRLQQDGAIAAFGGMHDATMPGATAMSSPSMADGR